MWRTVLLLDTVIAVQISLGATVIWTQKEAMPTSLHVTTGAVILGVATLLALRAWPLKPAEDEDEENDQDERELEIQTNQ